MSIHVSVASTEYEVESPSQDQIDDSDTHYDPWMYSESRPLHEIRSKRIFDLAVATFFLVLFGPLMVIISACLALTGGSVLLVEERIGAKGTPFSRFKFRTMESDAKSHSDDTRAGEPARPAERSQEGVRRTALGSLLFSSGLDELPQLVNVIIGDMSLVGPRPIKIQEKNKYSKLYHDYCRSRPGIFGLSQGRIHGHPDRSRRTELDSLYVAHWSFRRDLVILLKTVVALMTTRAAH